MRKRLLPALLALCLVMSLIPATVFATDPVDPGTTGSDPTTPNPPAETKTCACERTGCTSKDHKNGKCTATIPADDTDGLCDACAAYAAKDAVQCDGVGKTTCSRELPTGHLAGCKKACTQDENCPNGKNDPHSDEGCASLCNLSASCPAGQHHKENCLALCTGDRSCPNTAGDASVHRVQYGISERGSAPAQPFYATLAEAQAAAKKHNDEVNQGNPNGDTNWTAVTIYCPVAGVSDNVEINNPDPEPSESTKPTTPADPSQPSKAEDFTDVEGTEWFADDLTTLVQKGWFVGGANMGFSPTVNTTGAEVVVILSRVMGQDLVTTGSGWSMQASAWANKEGLSEGIEISTSGGIARKDLVLMLWRAAGKPESTQSLDGFTDVSDLEGDALTAMKWAVENKIVVGNGDGTISPDGNTRRCEMAALLVRYDKAVNG